MRGAGRIFPSYLRRVNPSNLAIFANSGEKAEE